MSILKHLPKETLNHFQRQLRYKNFFFVKKNNKSIRIDIDDILWVKADGPSVNITYKTGSVVTYANLSSFEKQIKHPNLIRVHRSYIVNLTNITAFDDQFLYLMDKQDKIPISRKYRKDVLGPFTQLRSD